MTRVFEAVRGQSLRTPVVVGLVAGIGVIYISAVGLVGAFGARAAISGVAVESGPGLLTLARVMLGGIVFLGAVNVAARLKKADSSAGPAPVLVSTAVTGAVAGLMLGLFVLLADAVPINAVISPAGPGLVDFLSFERGAAFALVAWPLIGAVIAAAGGTIYLLDERNRGAVLNALGIVLLLSLLEPVLRPVLGQMELRDLASWLYAPRGGGLTQPAALVIIVLVAVITLMWQGPVAPVRQRAQTLPAEQRRNVGMALAVAAIILILLLPVFSTGFVSQVLVNVGFFLMLALGLNIVVGYAGLLDLGYVAFYAVGAYTVGLMLSPTSALGGPLSTVAGVEWGFWFALPVVMIVAAFVGIFIGAPVLRLRGDYLAIVTLGFGEIARFLFRSEAVRPWVGGPSGVVGIPNMHIPILNIELTSAGQYFYPVVAFSALAAFVAWRLSRSRTGRAWNAMREDETVAASTGVNVTNYKLLAFALGGVLGGLAGALFAVQLRSVYPDSFLLIISFTALAIIILGGMGTIKGVIAGALILVGLPEALREFGEFRFLIYGAALVAMMVLRPEGLFPSRIRRAELHEDQEPEERPQLGEAGGAPIRGTGVQP